MTPPVEKFHAIRKPLTVVCILTWIAAFTVTHIPEETASHIPGTDPSLHFIGYVGVTGILWITVLAHRVRRMWRVLGVFFGTTAYSIFDELTQPLFGRSCMMNDWMANLQATVAFLVVAEIVVLLVSRTKTPGPETDSRRSD
jgi:VanZ family protein